jgi:hypothetical protein
MNQKIKTKQKETCQKKTMLQNPHASGRIRVGVGGTEGPSFHPVTSVPPKWFVCILVWPAVVFLLSVAHACAFVLYMCQLRGYLFYMCAWNGCVYGSMLMELDCVAFL